MECMCESCANHLFHSCLFVDFACLLHISTLCVFVLFSLACVCLCVFYCSTGASVDLACETGVN